MLRMPMIAVTATPLLLSLSLLLLLQTPTLTLAKAAITTTTTPASATFMPNTENSTVEETTSFGDMDFSTVTMKIDSDLIITTLDGIQSFTEPANELTTTEEPLPESVLQQLAKERAEGKLDASPLGNLIEKTTTSEATTTTGIENEIYNSNSNLISHHEENFEAKKEIAKETTTYMPEFEASATPIDNMGYYINTHSYGAQTDNVQDTTFTPLAPFKSSSESLSMPVEQFASEDTLFDQTTWFQPLADLFESTQPTGEVQMDTTLAPELISSTTTERTTTTPQSIIPATEKPYDIVQLLRMMNSDVVTTKIMPESVTEFSTTEESSTESGSTTESAIETTFTPTKLEKMLENIVMTTMKVPDVSTTEEIPTTTMEPTTSATSKPIEDIAETTLEAMVMSSTENVPETSSSSTTGVQESIVETTIEPPRQLSMLEAMLMSTTESVPETTSTTVSSTTSTTTESVPETTSTTASTTTPTTTESVQETTSTTASTTAPTTTESVQETTSTTASTTTPTTTESVPETTSTTVSATTPSTTASTTPSTTTLSTTASTTPSTTTSTTPSTTTTTTEAIPVVVTRAPRVERIFNSDGVEVLYGYSSVVRTNHV